MDKGIKELMYNLYTILRFILRPFYVIFWVLVVLKLYGMLTMPWLIIFCFMVGPFILKGLALGTIKFLLVKAGDWNKEEVYNGLSGKSRFSDSELN